MMLECEQENSTYSQREFELHFFPEIISQVLLMSAAIGWHPPDIKLFGAAARKSKSGKVQCCRDDCWCIAFHSRHCYQQGFTICRQPSARHHRANRVFLQKCLMCAI